jgi:signal transduction histidine kinase
MNRNAFSIKFILLFFVVTIVLTWGLSTFVFTNQHSQLQNQLTYLQLHQTVNQLAEQLDKEIELAQQNILRLLGYLSILDLESGINDEIITYLTNMMAENLQFENNHYSSYIALEPNKARQYFNERGKFFLVYKNIALRDSARYNKPQHMLQKSWNEPSYANDPRKSWYYLSKQNVGMQITPIYFDADYTNMSLFSISQGLYEHRTFQGVVGISILVDTFFEDIENQKFGKTGGMFLADSQKGVLLSKIGHAGSTKLAFLEVTGRESFNLYSAEQPFWKNILNQDTPYIEVKNPVGELYTLSSKKLRTLPWTLVSFQQTAELKQDSLFGLSSLIILATLVLLLVIAMTLALFKRLIWPLCHLVNQAKNATKTSNQLGIAKGSVIELHQLAERFRKMTTLLKRINQERSVCIKQLQTTRLTSAKRARKIERYQAFIVKAKVEIQNSRADTQKSRLQNQKARVEIQRHKLESKRAKIKIQAATHAKEQFLSHMGHELRTPMNAIIGYTEMLQEDVRERGLDELLADLQKIHGAGYHLLDLINNLFDMSRIDSSQMDLYIDTFDIAPMIQDVVSTITPLLEKQTNILKVECDPALGTMSADLAKVRQNLLNLLTNANKFSKQSSILLTVHRETEDTLDWIIFTVTDQGIGMTKEQIDKLFQAFVQFEASPGQFGRGTGLGLAITKQFCQIMGGDISVDSQFGMGSTFTMRLPAEVTPVENA